jgi:glycine dehydrogenase
MSGLYAVYHGPEGLKQIATHVHESAVNLANQLRENGVNVVHMHFFDTIRLALAPDQLTEVRHRAESHEINFHYDDDGLQISLSETVLDEDIVDILDVLKVLGKGSHPVNGASLGLPGGLIRTSEYLTHPVFQRHTTETEMMRYLKFLENRDLSLVHAMIPLGSCTMKLNAAAQLMPVSWHAFAHVHPFAPSTQTEGYRQMIIELEQYLCEITE